MKKKTVWSVFRDFVNIKPVGSIVSRTEIMQQLRKDYDNGRNCNN